MGLMKWFAQKGAVGGTARWAANGYKSIMKKDPNIEMTDLYIELIRSRYAVMPNRTRESFLISTVSPTRGLLGLVVAVLEAEAAFAENTHANKRMFIEIIEEELYKKGVPQDVIQGS